QPSGAAVVAGGEVLRPPTRVPHVHGAGVRAGDRRPDLAGGGLDRDGIRVRPSRAAQVEDRLARAVAGQLGLGAVGVDDPQAAGSRAVTSTTLTPASLRIHVSWRRA